MPSRAKKLRTEGCCSFEKFSIILLAVSEGGRGKGKGRAMEGYSKMRTLRGQWKSWQ
jgi:hypothetical protein